MNNEALMRAYYEAYNSEDESRVAALLADDVAMAFAQEEQAGRDAYLATYRHMITSFEDRLTPERIAADSAGATVDVYNRLVARIDVADFLGREVRAGEVVELRFTARYTIRDQKIARIDIDMQA